VEQGQREPEQGRELADTSAKPQDLLPELSLRACNDVETDHDRRCLGEPPPSRRPRDTALRGDA